ncbi:MAG: response regulator [Verrucomicrobiae bacterium]|nr:response regulator [Verrucomicrobiae bacterium]
MEPRQRLKEALDPLVIRLGEVSEALRLAVGEGVTSEDAGKLCIAVTAFGDTLSGRFSVEPESDEDEWLRSLRHDLKNHLNHIVGPAQFISMECGDATAPESLGEVLSVCQQCLTVLNGEGSVEDAELITSGAIGTAVAPGLILVADDDSENRELLSRLLESMGHETLHAANGREALEIIRANERLDAVLLDIRMPEMDGFTVLEHLRESGHLRHTPVIVVTGLQEERDAVRCIEIGAEDFLSRPIRPALLTARLNASLEKKRLREKVFEQHFTPELAREFARNVDPMKMKGRNAEVTVLFCDIRGFSTVSERLGPEQTIDWLGAVMGEFSGCVIDHGGVLVDYTGDELLAMWGAPSEQPDHAERACRAAIEMLDALPALNERWRSVIDAETAIGIGISTGPALVGNIGTHRKFKYGPLGTTVNLGSRVQGATKYLRTPLLVTGETIEQLATDSDFHRRRLCRVRVQNIREPVELWEIVSQGREGWSGLKDRYEEALAYFENCQFHKASAVLGELLVRFPGDGPSLLLMSRVVDAMLEKGERGDDTASFNPVWELQGK